MQEKAKRELLLPAGRKTAAFKAQNIKHDPIAEFRGSVYRWAGDDHPTRLKFPAPAFKGALASAALEVPGAKKAQIGRLVWVEGFSVDIYGTPELLMSVVRSADIAKTPDIRTRAILPEWCCRLVINYIRPTLTQQALAVLLQWSGLVIAVGDFRQEKGKGSYGQFRLVNEDDPEFRRIVETGSRELRIRRWRQPCRMIQNPRNCWIGIPRKSPAAGGKQREVGRSRRSRRGRDRLRHGPAGLGMAGRGLARRSWHGMSRLGMARRGLAVVAGLGEARRGVAGPGLAWLGGQGGRG